MAIDQYSPCPCGSGKKLKFCCSDLAHEIQKIEKLVSGEQPHAALKHVEHLLDKQPERASLLDLKASIEMGLDQLEDAQSTIQVYLLTHPDNPSAYGQAAIMAAAKGETAAAVGALQEALDRVPDRQMPQRVFEAIGAVGHALLITGDLIAARGHLILYAGMSPDEDNRAIDLLLRMNLQGGLPLLLRDTLYLHELSDQPSTDQPPWSAVFEEAGQLARRGLWRRAEAEYVKLAEQAKQHPDVAYNLAVVRGWLGDAAQFASGMHHFAQLATTAAGAPTDEAVEAEALAQLVDPDLDEPKLETVRVTYPVGDDDLAAERLAAHKQTEHYELDPQSLGEAAHPRESYVLLDRPVPSTGVDLAIEDAPNVLAFLSLYGKRTDRDAQIELTTDRGEHFQEVETLVVDILGDACQAQSDTEVVAEKPAAEEALSWRWRLPDDTPSAHRRALLAKRRQHAILEDWVAAPRGALDGKSPLEAANDEAARLPLLGSVLIVEQAAADPSEFDLFAQLRDKLNLPGHDPVTCEQEQLNQLPLVRLTRLELSGLGDLQLQKLLNRTVMGGANLATLRVAEELVGRDTVEEGVDLASAYRQLIRAEPAPDRALEWVRKATKWTEASGESAAEWALLELELQIERSDAEGLQQSLNHIREKHINEAGVAEAVYKLLYSAGLVPPEEMQASQHPTALPQESQAGGLWTPGGEAAAAAPAQSDPAQAKSAIWTP
ncbi:SEC-C domain-containing protein [Adhaeretor mobilis]|uniref:Uncharacterized protein n=1 Tax=Adhaeretor mobilis TaxID=1930276 RepID=A0A517MRS7_9BACT|nr:SEC-C domain-containing protein [Adhaeretor mobilis]QDS97583.1 hypothetical protein HG15A2_08460 [Adhaeretor mobilis]